MLNKNSLMQAKTLATIAAGKNLTIMPATSTPVEELSKPCFNTLLFMAKATNKESVDFDFEFDQAALVVSSGCNGNGQSAHDQLMDSYIDEVSKAVASHLSYAKNVVKPTIVEMVDQVKNYMSQEPEVGSEFNVKIHDIPAPMKDSGFEDQISKFQGMVYSSPDITLMLKEKAPQEILETMLTGSKSFDEKINEWYAKMGDAWFLEAYNNFFTDVKVTQPSLTFSFDDALLRDAEYDDYALFVYLVASKYYDDVQEGTGLSLSRYKEVLSQYKLAAGARLHFCYKKYDSDAKLNMLVVSYSEDRKTIVVNGHVYRPWIAGGGENEVLLGLLVSKDVTYHSKAIDEKAQQYRQAWGTYLNLQATAYRNKAFVRFKDVLRIAFEQSLRNPFEAEKEFISKNSAYMENVTKYFDQEMSTVTSQDMGDVYNICTRLVCRSRFYYTDAEKILCSINEAVKYNPHILDVREAALIATIEYVCDFIADQLLVQ